MSVRNLFTIILERKKNWNILTSNDDGDSNNRIELYRVICNTQFYELRINDNHCVAHAHTNTVLWFNQSSYTHNHWFTAAAAVVRNESLSRHRNSSFWTIFALVLVRVSENEISFWQLSLIELQYSCGTTVISVQSQSWTRHRSIIRIDKERYWVETERKFKNRSIPSPFQVQTNSNILPIFSSVSAKYDFNVFIQWIVKMCSVCGVSSSKREESLNLAQNE